jgi:hypothetical protein
VVEEARRRTDAVAIEFDAHVAEHKCSR